MVKMKIHVNVDCPSCGISFAITETEGTKSMRCVTPGCVYNDISFPVPVILVDVENPIPIDLSGGPFMRDESDMGIGASHE